MSILKDHVFYYLSGGVNNNDPLRSLGGQISSTKIVDPTQVFDRLNWNETYYGYTDYRCVYLKNTHPSLTAHDVVGYITQGLFEGTNKRSPEFITFQYDPAGVGDGINTGVAVGPMAHETVPPTGVNFPENPPQTEDEAIESPMGHFNLGPAQCIAIWLRRRVPPHSEESGWTRPKFTAVMGE